MAEDEERAEHRESLNSIDPTDASVTLRPVGGTLEDARRWRQLASEVRGYVVDVATEAARAELLQAAERWERQAAEVEAAVGVTARAE
jgi:hypothetical protein